MQSLWMVVAALFFAGYGVFIKLSGAEGIGSWEILFFRSIFGVFVFYVMLRLAGGTVYTSHPWHHIVRSLCGTSAIVAGIYSISHLNLGLAMTLNYTAPLFVGTYVAVTSIAHHQRMNFGLMSTVITGFVGVVVLLGPTIGPNEYFASVVGLSAGMFTAIATTFVKKLGLLKEPEARIIFYLVLVGAVVGFIGVILTGGFHAWSWTSALYILLLCICATMGQFCLTRAFSRGNIILSSALLYTVILFATIDGVIIFGEPVSITGVLGMIIIVLSGFFATYFVRRENARRFEAKPKNPRFEKIEIHSSREDKRKY